MESDDPWLGSALVAALAVSAALGPGCPAVTPSARPPTPWPRLLAAQRIRIVVWAPTTIASLLPPFNGIGARPQRALAPRSRRSGGPYGPEDGRLALMGLEWPGRARLGPYGPGNAGRPLRTRAARPPSRRPRPALTRPTVRRPAWSPTPTPPPANSARKCPGRRASRPTPGREARATFFMVDFP